MTKASWLGKLTGFAAVVALGSTLVLAESNGSSHDENGTDIDRNRYLQFPD